MLQLEYPYPTPTTTFVLPSAELDNSIIRDDKQNLQQAMDGTFYTYLTTNNLYVLTCNVLNISRTDLDTLKTIYKTQTRFRLTDHLTRQWDVRIQSSPLEITIDKPDSGCDEAGSVSLQFIGTYLGVLYS